MTRVNRPSLVGWMVWLADEPLPGAATVRVAKLLAQTCTVWRARRLPPVMWKLARWVVLAVVASIIVLQALAGPPLVRTRLT